MAVSSMELNVYCDESCYLEKDSSKYMVLGSIICPKQKVKEVTLYIKELKKKYGIKNHCELKWVKISPSKIDFYKELLNYFFIEDDLNFRGIICNKSILNHNKFNQTHDDWYYKMYYDMLKYIFIPENSYYIYADIKDTHSYSKLQILSNYLKFNMPDYNGKVIKNVQPIRSHESSLMQLSDILIGALSYYYRELNTSSAKLKIIDILKKKSRYGIDVTTPYHYRKFNLLVWNPYDNK